MTDMPMTDTIITDTPMTDTPMTGAYCATCHTALGHMRAISDGDHLIRLDWDQQGFAAPDTPDDVSRETCRQLVAYLAGDLLAFDLPLRAEGKSDTARRRYGLCNESDPDHLSLSPRRAQRWSARKLWRW